MHKMYIIHKYTGFFFISPNHYYSATENEHTHAPMKIENITERHAAHTSHTLAYK